MQCQPCMLHVDKAPCPPPDVSPDMFYAVARQNNISQNIADQIRWRCSSASPVGSHEQTTATANVGLTVGIVLGVAAALVLVAVAVYLYKR